MNALCMSLIIISTVLASKPDSAKDLPSYGVKEIVSVRSVSEFECRLAGYPYSKNARFRVKIRSVASAAGVSTEAGMDYVTTRLKNAGEIRLENIQFRNYFRVSADVVVDGIDLGGELLANQLAVRPDEMPPANVTNQPIRPRTPLRTHPTIAAGRRPASPRQASMRSNTRNVISLNSLLATKIDISLINEDTTFEEALGILSDSVWPRLPLVVLWSDLETNAMIDRDTPIGLGGAGAIELKQVLNLILLSVSTTGGLKPELAYEGNVITIGTQRGLLQRSANKVYPITDLTSSGYDEYGQLSPNGQGLSRVLLGDSIPR